MASPPLVARPLCLLALRPRRGPLGHNTVPMSIQLLPISLEPLAGCSGRNYWEVTFYLKAYHPLDL